MKRTTLHPFLLLSVLLIGGCAASPFVQTSVTTRSAQVAPDAGPPAARAYACDDGSRVRMLVTPEAARIDLGERTRRLVRVAADEGRRYGRDEVRLHLRGERLDLVSPRGSRECSDAGPAGPWANAALRGVEVRAIGHEPSWSLELAPERWLHFVPMGEGDALLARNPVHAIGTDGTRRYTARAGGRELRVSIRETACTDTMSGERFALQVTVTLDGRTLEGCGRRLETPDASPIDPA